MKSKVAAADTGYTETHDIHDTQETQEFRILRYGELKETQDTHDSARECRVATIPEAVERSLVSGINETCLFVFVRALKAFEIHTNCRLDAPSKGSAFSLWWATAKLLLPDGEEYGIWESEFLMAFEKARVPLGMNTLTNAIAESDAKPWPEICTRYSPSIGRVIAVCFHLQRLCLESAFFLSVRDAQRIGGFKTTFTAQAVLLTLIRDGIIEEVEKGTQKGRRASRYKYIVTT